MAEGVLFTIAESLIEMLVSAAFEETRLLSGVTNELQKLADTTTRIQAVLLDAEEKMAANNQVKVWLKKLEDAFFEADDLLDEFNAEALRRRVMSGNKFTRQVCIFFSSSNQLVFRLKMGHKIKDIRERLDEIKENEKFNLTSRLEDTIVCTGSHDRETYSFVGEEEVIGRDDDKKIIIQLLVESKFEENVSIIPIVGIGGLGKTTLAQYVFNDEKVQKHFELKMWVCVSDVFDVNSLVKKILESATLNNPENLALEPLTKKLRGELNERRYLLVLDDVWNEDGEKWLMLERLLKCGGRGSRVLITTRSEMVARITQTVQPYSVKGLGKDMSWSLFKRMAFEKGQEPMEGSKIMELGKEVVEKCKGVPLAIRTIGRLLQSRLFQSQSPEKELLFFRDNELAKISQNENDILPTLRLSYNHLPSHLKHCFAYCSLFPKDHKIKVVELIHLWMAQGFIKCSNRNQCLEDVGYEYFINLLWRSFFQEPEEDRWGKIRTCKMHDLMHDLATSVSGTNNVIINQNTEMPHKNILHVSVDYNLEINESCLASLSQQKRLRTFLPLEGGEGNLPTLVHSLFKFKALRSLSLAGMYLNSFPNSLGELVHLRYLDLSYNSIKMLPSSLTRLQNLQTLILMGRHSLERLPRNMKKLVNLRHLRIEGCYEMTCMPRGFGKLTNLQTLDRFVVSDHIRYGFHELSSLNNLRGDLEITNLGHTKHIASTSKDANLKQKQYLQTLRLEWDGVVGEEVNGNIVENDEISLEGLQPHSNLKVLQVSKFMGLRFGGWLSSLTNLIELRLENCKKCQYLPALDKLPSLKTLSIESVEAEYMFSSSEEDANIFASTTPFFPSLVRLHIQNCRNLKWWWWKREDGNDKDDVIIRSFPRLSDLTIRYCPKLTSMPLFPYIESVDIKRTSSKPLQQTIMMMSNQSVDQGNLLSSLKSIRIEDCTDLVSLPDEVGNIASLESITIWACPNLTSLPEGIGKLSSLKSITIYFSLNLTSLPEGIGKLSSLKSITIYLCLNLTSLPEGIGNLPSLESIAISYCDKLTSLPEGIGNLPSLKSINIDLCGKLTSLPEGIGKLSSLESITIRNCRNLTSLPEGIGNLPSLESITIWDCPNLTSVPDKLSSLSSLKKIDIRYCPKLEERYHN